MADTFKQLAVGRDSPATDWFAITPNNDTDIPLRPRFIYVGTAGNINMQGDSGAAVVLPVAVGYHPFGPARILATSTTASGIVGFV
jgi:hypothetical protein